MRAETGEREVFRRLVTGNARERENLERENASEGVGCRVSSSSELDEQISERRAEERFETFDRLSGHAFRQISPRPRPPRARGGLGGMGEALSKMARDRGIAAPAGSRGSRGSRGSGGSRVGGVDGWVDLEDLEDDGDLEHLSDEALDELEAALRSEGLGVDDRATGDGDADVSEDAAMLEDAASSSIAASSDAAERAPGLDDASRRSRSRGGVASRRPRLPRLALLLSGARRLRAALASALGAARDAGSAFAESPAPRVALRPRGLRRMLRPPRAVRRQGGRGRVRRGDDRTPRRRPRPS